MFPRKLLFDHRKNFTDPLSGNVFVLKPRSGPCSVRRWLLLAGWLGDLHEMSARLLVRWRSENPMQRHTEPVERLCQLKSSWKR
jgi:hypothetical protein